MAAGSPSKNLGQIQRAIARRFSEAGLDTPMLDARVLVCAATGLTPEALIMQENAPLRRRAQIFAGLGGSALWGTPVSRLTGRREFLAGLRYRPAVLDPRADTETLVEAALGVAPKTGRVLDLGTGSGCVLISVLANAEGLQGLGVISPLLPCAMRVITHIATRCVIASDCSKEAGFRRCAGGSMSLCQTRPILRAPI